MHRFIVDDLSLDDLRLPEEEAHHAVHVLRVQPGSHVILVDGRGMSATAEVVESGKKGCSAHVVQRNVHAREREVAIHLAVAPTKQNDRFEWFVEKAVEIGVDRITPLMTERTERTRLRTDRLLRVAVSAMKQSQRTWLPQIDEPVALSALLREELPGQRFFGWCAGEHESLVARYQPTMDALVLIGPEGDFTPGEADALRKHQFQAVSLGAARLRTETAALAACTWMSFAQQAR
ncbi:MAG: 16S rRNA (uracil(1498)-N(3))-methyltransferase [Flavobacteriales bacterium]|nr:16S rRNA (uracil(1498)-N(3))-methyltransferase [Flavobacteriales bacterium]